MRVHSYSGLQNLTIKAEPLALLIILGATQHDFYWLNTKLGLLTANKNAQEAERGERASKLYCSQEVLEISC